MDDTKKVVNNHAGAESELNAGLDGCTLWGMIREYVQAEVCYRSCYDLGGPGADRTKNAAEQVTRTETAAREAFQKLLPSNLI